jgi:hypothetical protein
MLPGLPAIVICIRSVRVRRPTARHQGDGGQAGRTEAGAGPVRQRPGRRHAGAQGRAEGGSGPREEAGQEEVAGGSTEGGAGAVEAT